MLPQRTEGILRYLPLDSGMQTVVTGIDRRHDDAIRLSRLALHLVLAVQYQCMPTLDSSPSTDKFDLMEGWLQDIAFAQRSYRQQLVCVTA